MRKATLSEDEHEKNREKEKIRVREGVNEKTH